MGLAATLGAVAFAAFLWWFATGAVLGLGRAPEHWHGTALLALAVPALLALLGAWALADIATPASAFAGFAAGIALWSWHEASFLFGHVTGARREPCPAGAGTGERFRLALRALRDHEIALLLTVLLLSALLWTAPNRIALDVFLVLWLCRIASKLCIFEGVPAMAHEMMPDRLAYLKTYFGRGRPGAAFALAVLAMSIALVALVNAAIAAPSAHERVAATLLATMTALALLEHLFMVLPIRESRLWTWALRSGATDEGRSARSPRDGGAPSRAARTDRGRRNSRGEGRRTSLIETALVETWPRTAHGSGGRRLQGVALRPRAVVPHERQA